MGVLGERVLMGEGWLVFTPGGLVGGTFMAFVLDAMAKVVKGSLRTRRGKGY